MTTTGVWWDINTCPIPDGCDPGRVRSRIESALQEYIGPGCPVTIFCIGNLEFISPQILKGISSSGIHLRHSVYQGMGVCYHLDEWEERNPPPAKIMLVSSDSSWFNFSFYSPADTLFFAHFQILCLSQHARLLTHGPGKTYWERNHALWIQTALYVLRMNLPRGFAHYAKFLAKAVMISSTISRVLIIHNKWLQIISNHLFRPIYLTKWKPSFQLVSFFICICSAMYLGKRADGVRRPRSEPSIPLLSTSCLGDEIESSGVLKKLWFFKRVSSLWPPSESLLLV
ncbi:unnamed protein product [Arabis nemorensis]|uniref:NYN domain-containing protein n=1 Tax=Arabis nemorensis TaxID=586526 RepID=A0A565CIH1_9BRAS|nr:unnamed protein product [Arabis nemorensis]